MAGHNGETSFIKQRSFMHLNFEKNSLTQMIILQDLKNSVIQLLEMNKKLECLLFKMVLVLMLLLLYQKLKKESKLLGRIGRRNLFNEDLLEKFRPGRLNRTGRLIENLEYVVCLFCPSIISKRLRPISSWKHR